MERRPPSLLLVEAHRAAYHQAKTWIRSVFQEVHCSLWKEQWTRVNENNDNRIHITEPMIAKAQQVCRRVAQQWCQRLEAEGHFEFAKWVQEVLETEASTFYSGVEHDNNVEEAPLNTEEDEEDAHKTISDQNDEELPESAIENNNNESTQQKGVPMPTASCPLAALKRLRLPTHDATMTQSQREQYVIDQIDAMGRAGKTYWPFEWDIIQQAAQKVPERLYKSKKNFQLKLVPKSSQQNTSDDPLSTTSENNNEEAEPVPPDNPTMPPPEPRAAGSEGPSLEDIKMVVDYQRSGSFFKKRNAKRKAAASQNYSNNGNNKRQKTLPEDPSRPPYPTGHVEIPWNAAVAQQFACPELDAYVRPDESNEDEVQEEYVPHTILGALKTLGHIHNAIQIRHDYDEGEFEGFLPKKQRRKFTKSVKERIGPTQMEKVPRKHKVQSKVKRTMNENCDTFMDDDDEEDDDEDASNKIEMGTRFYVDFDMGECLLDLEAHTSNSGTPEAGRIPRRKLYAFSSLEVSLLDEDGPEHSRRKTTGTSNDESHDIDEGENEHLVAV